jgi:hypothetical protein
VLKVCRTSERLAIARSACPPSAEVRGAGFALLATFDHPHFTLVLADLSEMTIKPLDRCFDDPIPDPGQAPSG